MSTRATSRMHRLVDLSVRMRGDDMELVADDVARILRDCGSDQELMRAFAVAILRGLGRL